MRDPSATSLIGFRLSDYPADLLDLLRAVAREHGCIGLAIDPAGREVMVDDIRPLPGDRLLVVEEASLWESAARCRVATIESQFGFRLVRGTEITSWRVTTKSRVRSRARGPRPPDGLLNIREAGLHLDCDERSVRRYVAAGKLKAAKLGTGKRGAVRFSVEELRRFVASRTR